MRAAIPRRKNVWRCLLFDKSSQTPFKVCPTYTKPRNRRRKKGLPLPLPTSRFPSLLLNVTNPQRGSCTREHVSTVSWCLPASIVGESRRAMSRKGTREDRPLTLLRCSPDVLEETIPLGEAVQGVVAVVAAHSQLSVSSFIPHSHLSTHPPQSSIRLTSRPWTSRSRREHS